MTMLCSVIKARRKRKETRDAWYVYKPLFGSPVSTCRLACSEISLSIIEKKLERSLGKGRT